MSTTSSPYTLPLSTVFAMDAKNPFDKAETPNRRVHDNPHIRLQICAFLAKGDLARMARVDKAWWPDVTKVLYREINIRIYLGMSRDRVFSRLACDSVRVVDLYRREADAYGTRNKVAQVDGIPDFHLCRPLPDPGSLKLASETLIQKYPAIEEILFREPLVACNEREWDWGRSDWILSLQNGSEPDLLDIIYVLRPSRVDTGSTALGEFQETHKRLRESFRVQNHIWIDFVYDNECTASHDVQSALSVWLAGNLDSAWAVLGIRCDMVSTEVLLERIRGVESCIAFSDQTELYLRGPTSMFVDDIRQIAETMGACLGTLILHGHRLEERGIFADIVELPEIARILGEHCPNLQYLTIPLLCDKVYEPDLDSACAMKLPSLRVIEVQLFPVLLFKTCLPGVPWLLRFARTATRMKLSYWDTRVRQKSFLIRTESFEEDLTSCLLYFSRRLNTAQREVLLRTRPSDLDITTIKQYMSLEFDADDQPIPISKGYATDLLARLGDEVEDMKRTLDELEMKKRRLLGWVLADDRANPVDRATMEDFKSFEKDVQQLHNRLPLVCRSGVGSTWESIGNRFKRDEIDDVKSSRCADA